MLQSLLGRVCLQFATNIAQSASTMYIMLPLSETNIFQTSGQCRYYSKSKKSKTMVDPKRVLSYEDMLHRLHDTTKMIIDVREPEEVKKTGKIPSSINIPLPCVDTALQCMSEEEFVRRFRRYKPQCDDEIIFYCRSGQRSSEALEKALKLGYSNCKNYQGSWNEWEQKQKKR